MNPPPLNIPSSSSVRTVPEENSDTRESVGLTPVSSRVPTGISKKLMSQGLTPGTTAFRQEYQKSYHQTADYKASHRARQKTYNQT